MKKSFYTLLLFLVLSPLAFGQDYGLVFSDEFNSGSLDQDTWSYNTGTGEWGWGNNELQYYTRREKNIYLENGYLNIVGLRENYGGKNWTSARINSENKFEFMYGRVEIRAKLPAGKGLWPAFWMLGKNINEGEGWPYGGEIDMMEFRGHLTDQISSTIHFSAVSPENSSGDPVADRRYLSKEFNLETGSFSEDFHVFEYSWGKDFMKWSVDGQEYFSLTKSQIEEQTEYYPFDQPFFLILNLAIGGTFLGDQQPDASTPDTNLMQIDYIRVYQDLNKKPEITTNYPPSLNIETGTSFNLEASVTDTDGVVDSVSFYLNDRFIGGVNQEPFILPYYFNINGCYTLGLEAIDDDGAIAQTTDNGTFVVGSGCTKESYNDNPIPLPGILYLEEFDRGGQNVSYFDSSPDTNTGGLFRPHDAVDISKTDDNNIYLSDLSNGEWTEYQVDIKETGMYNIELRIIPNESSGQVSLELDGERIGNFFFITSSCGEYNCKKLANIELQKGVYTLRVNTVYEVGGLDQLTFDLQQATSSETETSGGLPKSVQLNQNYPNPFNPSTQIGFTLPSARQAELVVYNNLGQQIAILHSGRLAAGNHQFTFNAEEFGSGIYYYKLFTGNEVLTRKMLLVK